MIIFIEEKKTNVIILQKERNSKCSDNHFNPIKENKCNYFTEGKELKMQ